VRTERGFTIIEVLVAVMVLTVGILGLVTTAALVTRMVGQGERYSQVSTLAAERLEILRSRSCTSLASGSASQQSFTISWTVDSLPGANARTVRIVVVSPTVRGTRADTFTTTRIC